MTPLAGLGTASKSFCVSACGGIDARQAEEREGRIVGVDGELDAHLFGRLRDLAHEEEEMLAQAFDA